MFLISHFLFFHCSEARSYVSKSKPIKQQNSWCFFPMLYGRAKKIKVQSCCFIKLNFWWIFYHKSFLEIFPFFALPSLDLSMFLQSWKLFCIMIKSYHFSSQQDDESNWTSNFFTKCIIPPLLLSRSSCFRKWWVEYLWFLLGQFLSQYLSHLSKFLEISDLQCKTHHLLKTTLAPSTKIKIMTSSSKILQSTTINFKCSS